jgi:thermostable 8-oxoguanine DNA glycosylase
MAGHVVRVGEKTGEFRVWWESFSDRQQFKELSVCGDILLIYL